MGLNIPKMDMSGVSPAGTRSYPPAGFHCGEVENLRTFDDPATSVYAYIQTQGQPSVREKFWLNPKGRPFVLAFLISAGCPPEKIAAEVSEETWEKIMGKRVYFHYTPPELTDNGDAVAGSYPRFVFYTQAKWEALAGTEGENGSSDYSFLDSE